MKKVLSLLLCLCLVLSIASLAVSAEDGTDGNSTVVEEGVVEEDSTIVVEKAAWGDRLQVEGETHTNISSDYAGFDNGKYIEYSIDIATGGVYDIYATGKSKDGGKMQAYVYGGYGVMGEITANGVGWDVETVDENLLGTTYIPAGTHTLKVVYIGSDTSFLMNKLLIKQADDQTPVISLAAAKCASTSTFIDKGSHLSATGGIAYAGDGNMRHIDFDFYAPANGLYNLDFFYGTLNKAASVSVDIDGVEAIAVQNLTPAEGYSGGSVWCDLGDVELTKGNHKIALKANSGQIGISVATLKKVDELSDFQYNILATNYLDDGTSSKTVAFMKGQGHYVASEGRIRACNNYFFTYVVDVEEGNYDLTLKHKFIADGTVKLSIDGVAVGTYSVSTASETTTVKLTELDLTEGEHKLYVLYSSASYDIGNVYGLSLDYNGGIKAYAYAAPNISDNSVTTIDYLKTQGHYTSSNVFLYSSYNILYDIAPRKGNYTLSVTYRAKKAEGTEMPIYLNGVLLDTYEVAYAENATTVELGTLDITEDVNTLAFKAHNTGDGASDAEYGYTLYEFKLTYNGGPSKYVIEAENFDRDKALKDEQWYKDQTHLSATGFMYLNTNTYAMSYNVNIVEDGNYKLFVKYGTNSVAGAKVTFYVDGDVLETYNLPLAPGYAGGNTVAELGTVNLTAGDHVIKVCNLNKQDKYFSLDNFTLEANGPMVEPEIVGTSFTNKAGEISLSSDTAYTGAKLIFASYSGTKLVDYDVTDIDVVAGQTVSVSPSKTLTAGDKTVVMLWNGTAAPLAIDLAY